MEEILAKLRLEWWERMKYWCKAAESSPMAADIERMAAREGFCGERARLFRYTILKRVYKISYNNNKLLRLSA